MFNDLSDLVNTINAFKDIQVAIEDERAVQRTITDFNRKLNRFQARFNNNLSEILNEAINDFDLAANELAEPTRIPELKKFFYKDFF